MIAPRSLDHIGYEFGSDGCTRFIFFILSCVRETRNDSSDPSSGGRPTSIDHDEKFHQVVVDTVRTRLHNENILIPNRFPFTIQYFRLIAMGQYQW